MKKGIFCILAALIGLIPFLTGCEDNKAEEHPGLWLTVDKATITADGKDMATFTVTLDGVDVTSECTFCNQYNNCSDKNTFSTRTTGEYVFHATYSATGEESNEVTVTAVESEAEHPGLWLMVDKATIAADGEETATFTVTLYDVDVTSECTFCNQYSCYGKNTFSTTTPDEYVFHATYLETGENSNEVTVTAVAQ